jgi:NADH-quinone oxidoreductase subunit M
LSIVVTAIYILRAANGILHGPLRLEGAHLTEAGSGADLTDAVPVEKIAVLILLACILGLGLFPGRVAALLDQALLPILNNLNR